MNLEFRVLCLDNTVVFPTVVCLTFPLVGVIEKEEVVQKKVNHVLWYF